MLKCTTLKALAKTHKIFKASPVALNWNFSPDCSISVQIVVINVQYTIPNKLVLSVTNTSNTRTKMFKNRQKNVIKYNMDYNIHLLRYARDP